MITPIAPIHQVPLPVDEWFQFIVRYKKSQTIGKIEAWLNIGGFEVKIYDVSNRMTNPSPYIDDVYASINNYAESTSPAEKDVYLDDVLFALSDKVDDIDLFDIVLEADPSGSVVKSPSGAQVTGEAFTLTATPPAGKRFVRLHIDGSTLSTDNPYNGTMGTEDEIIAAEYEDIPKWDVIISASPPEGGTVEEISTGPDAEDEDFEIEATPAEGYRFVNWTIYGMYFYDQPNYVGTMGTEDLPLVANYEPVPDPDPDPEIIYVRGWRFSE